MTERPILFSAPMVRAILDGRKTQTRRVVKPSRHQIRYARAMGMEPSAEAAGQAARACLVKDEWSMCPYGQPGDRLWVRETWNAFDGWAGYFYAADDHSFGIGADDDPDHIPEHAIRWRPSIHMPRAASRITLEITEVRVERLSDISEHDAMAEGVSGWVKDERCETARDGFRVLWESINGPDSWAANPWVWVVGFRR